MEEHDLSFNSTVDFASLFLSGLDHDIDNTPKPMSSDILDTQHTNFLLEVNPNHMLPVNALRMGNNLNNLSDYGLPSLELPLSLDQEMQNTTMREPLINLQSLPNPPNTQEPDLELGFSYLDVLKAPERNAHILHTITPTQEIPEQVEAPASHSEYVQLQELGIPTTPIPQNGTTIVDDTESGPRPAKIPKRRKTASDKDHSAGAKKRLPKAALTPYLCYVNERKPYYKSTYPNMSLKEIVSAVGREWSGLDPLARKPYEEMAEQDKQRYAEDVRALKANIEQDRGDVSTPNNGDDCGTLPLFCSVCQIHFANVHNQNEHMASRGHQEALRTRKTLGLHVTGKSRIEELMDTLKESVHARNIEIMKLMEKKAQLQSTNTSLNQTLSSLQEKDKNLHEELNILNRASPRLTTTIKNLMNTTRNLKTLTGAHNNVTGYSFLFMQNQAFQFDVSMATIIY